MLRDKILDIERSKITNVNLDFTLSTVGGYWRILSKEEIWSNLCLPVDAANDWHLAPDLQWYLYSLSVNIIWALQAVFLDKLPFKICQGSVCCKCPGIHIGLASISGLWNSPTLAWREEKHCSLPHAVSKEIFILETLTPREFLFIYKLKIDDQLMMIKANFGHFLCNNGLAPQNIGYLTIIFLRLVLQLKVQKVLQG